jgi:hypothetical protein
MDKSTFDYIFEMVISICQVLPEQQEHLDMYDAYKTNTQFLIISQQVNYCQAFIPNEDTG